MTMFDDYVRRARAAHGDKLNLAGLPAKFVPYFGTGDRIKILTSYGETMTGTVGVTTGWIPKFLLMRRSNAHGSSILLEETDRIIAVKHEGSRNYMVKP